MKRFGGLRVAITSTVAVVGLVAVAGCHVSGAPAAPTVPIPPPEVSTDAHVDSGVKYVRQVTVSTPTTPSPAAVDSDDGE